MGFEEVALRSKMPFLSYHIKSTYCQQDLSLLVLTLITWLRQCLSGFFTVKLLFSPFPYCPFRKAVTLCSLRLRSRQLRSAVQMIQSSSAQICLFSLIYWFIQSYQYGLMAIYFIYTLSYNSILINFVVQIGATLASGSSLSWRPCPLMYPINVVFFFFFFLPLSTCLLLVLQDALDSFCIFLAPVLKSAISPWSPGFFLESGVRNQYLGARCAHC